MNKVLHIVSGDLWGGAEAQVLLQLDALSATAWKPHLLLFNSGQLFNRASERGIPVTLVSESNGFISLTAGAIGAARHIAPVIVVSHGYKESIVGFFIARRLGIPLITTYHGLTEQLSGLQGLKLLLYLQIQRVIARFGAARIVTVSNRLRLDLGLNGNPRVRVVRNVTTPPSALNLSSPVQRQINPPAIVALGRLVPVKRLDLAVEAVRLLRQNPEFKIRADGIELRIAGEGPEEKSLRRQVEDGGIANSVRFLGFQNDPAALLSSSAALIISSDSEGIPTALLEALATFTPVVATDVGGISEVMQLFPGYPFRLVPAGSAMELAQAINSLLTEVPPAVDPAAVRETLNTFFSPPAAAKQLDCLYTELMAR